VQILMSVRREAGQDDEAEPVTVEVRGKAIVLVLDDGIELELDRRELVNAVFEDAA